MAKKLLPPGYNLQPMGPGLFYLYSPAGSYLGEFYTRRAGIDAAWLHQGAGKVKV